METFTEARALVDNPHFARQRKTALERLDLSAIDTPIVNIIQLFTNIPSCFTLQSCYGHFLWEGDASEHNINPLPRLLPKSNEVEFRIAYIAFCVDADETGKTILHDLKSLITIDTEYVHFGSADWFWDLQINSFVLQVEPARYKYQDRCIIDYSEALHIEKIRNCFFDRLEEAINKRKKS